MGMSDNMLACIRAIAENRIQDAKQYAICCCVEDGTKVYNIFNFHYHYSNLFPVSTGTKKPSLHIYSFNICEPTSIVSIGISS